MKVSEVDIRRFRQIENLYAVSIEELRERLAAHGAEAGVEIPATLVPRSSKPHTVGAAFRQQASQALADGKSGSLVVITLKAVRAAVSSGIAKRSRQDNSGDRRIRRKGMLYCIAAAVILLLIMAVALRAAAEWDAKIHWLDQVERIAAPYERPK